MSAEPVFPHWDDFRALARRRLHALPAGTGREPDRFPSDFDLNPELKLTAPPLETLTSAAVLVPIIERDEPTVLLTVRTGHLSSHAGQIAFPGGKIDAEDADARTAALREAHEEIGLDPGNVNPLGYLDNYRTGTGFIIHPLVGIVDQSSRLRPNPVEVEDVFEVPLSFLLDAANHRRDSRDWNGITRHFHAIPFGKHYIWGATAGIIRNMHERLFGE